MNAQIRSIPPHPCSKMVRSSFACVFLHPWKRPPCVEQDEFLAEDQPMVGASSKSWGGGSRLPCLLAYFHSYRALQHPHVRPQPAEVAFRITLVASNSAVQVFLNFLQHGRAHLWLQQNLVRFGPGFEKILQFVGIWRPLRAFILHERHTSKKSGRL